jgi:hypothetical protein
MPASHFNDFEVYFFQKSNWREIKGKKFYSFDRHGKFVFEDGKTEINWQTAAIIFFKMDLK